MTSLLDALGQRLVELEAADLRRSLQPPRGIDLSSNDYLGLASHPGLLEGVQRRLASLGPDQPVASPASRLLRGNTRRHMDLEARLADWKGSEAALLFTSGFQANVGLLSTVVQPQDTVISDAANHASLIDGLRLARCRKVIVPHIDPVALERALIEHTRTPSTDGRVFVVTESLYSMDGDIAPLDVYAELAERHGAELIVDDSHAAGVYGDARGSGLCEHFGVTDRILASVSTFGKALASSGAFVAGSATLIDYLVNRCRAFVFTTASPPLHLLAVEAALDLIRLEPQRRRRVLELADDLRRRLRRGGVDCLGSRGPIVPVLIGDAARALAVAARLQEEGFDVRAIRPPTVAPGTARLRLSVHGDHRRQDLERLADRLLQAVAAEGPGPLPTAVEAGERGNTNKEVSG